MKNKLLIIDDDEEMCAELKEIFENEGYLVNVAMEGNTGKDMLEQENYNTILLDLRLPGISGFEILKIAKNKPNAPHVIIFSGRPLGDNNLPTFNPCEIEENNILKLADVIMNKPVYVNLLIEKVRIFDKKYEIVEKSQHKGDPGYC